MKVAFVFPDPPGGPPGAHGVVYRLGRSLSARGHCVLFLHPRRSLRKPDQSVGNADVADDVVIVDDLATPSIWETFDAVVATSWHVVLQVDHYASRMGRGFFLHMDLEGYLLGEDSTRSAMATSFSVPRPMITISHALTALVRSVVSRPVATIPCAVDTDRFRVKVPIDASDRQCIGFPARAERAKQTFAALEALDQVRHTSPRIRAWCFGHEAFAVPGWIEHTRSPTDRLLCDLYNQTRVFVVPSLVEGFGLPGAEAMACGAALVSTDNGGVRSYAQHELTALLSPPGEPDRLATAIRRLLHEDHLRQRLARRGAAAVGQRTWAHVAAEFENVLNGPASEEIT